MPGQHPQLTTNTRYLPVVIEHLSCWVQVTRSHLGRNGFSVEPAAQREMFVSMEGVVQPSLFLSHVRTAFVSMLLFVLSCRSLVFLGFGLRNGRGRPLLSPLDDQQDRIN